MECRRWRCLYARQLALGVEREAAGDRGRVCHNLLGALRGSTWFFGLASLLSSVLLELALLTKRKRLPASARLNYCTVDSAKLLCASRSRLEAPPARAARRAPSSQSWGHLAENSPVLPPRRLVCGGQPADDVDLGPLRGSWEIPRTNW